MWLTRIVVSLPTLETWSVGSLLPVSVPSLLICCLVKAEPIGSGIRPNMWPC